jgi:hypothetical protein
MKQVPGAQSLFATQVRPVVVQIPVGDEPSTRHAVPMPS